MSVTPTQSSHSYSSFFHAMYYLNSILLNDKYTYIIVQWKAIGQMYQNNYRDTSVTWPWCSFNIMDLLDILVLNDLYNSTIECDVTESIYLLLMKTCSAMIYYTSSNKC